jgi:hypothetical protein
MTFQKLQHLWKSVLSLNVRLISLCFYSNILRRDNYLKSYTQTVHKTQRPSHNVLSDFKQNHEM